MPWEDEQLQQLVRELETMHSAEVRYQQSKIKERTKELKSISFYYSELADNINSAAMGREVEREFAMEKKIKIYNHQEKFQTV